MLGTKFTMNTRDKRKKSGVTEINLTSLIDVSLTLVIIFMVSFPLVMQSGINVSAPSKRKAQTQMEETELNGYIIDADSLADTLKTLIEASKEKLVVVSAEPNVLHDRVVGILDQAKQLGARQLSIIKRKK
jgi:biopolymer transport protein ExbD